MLTYAYYITKNTLWQISLAGSVSFPQEIPRLGEVVAEMGIAICPETWYNISGFESALQGLITLISEDIW
jgi:hypothetical protein